MLIAVPGFAEEPPVAASRQRSLDWPQWGGTSKRNNTPEGKNIPIEWDVGGFDRKTGVWKKEKAKNIKWMADLGSLTIGTPVGSNVHPSIGNK